MAYASVEDIRKVYKGEFDEDLCEALLDNAAIMIDACNSNVSDNVKKLVSCNMVVRVLVFNGSDSSMPLGATQGTMSALGYSQTFTLGNSGGTGELYFSKTDRKLLGIGNKIASHSPLEDM